MSVWVLINGFFAWYSLKWAQRDFDNGNSFSGWVFIVLSAWNTATVLDLIF